MKKAMVFLLCMMLLLPCAAQAGGLPDLGGLPDISGGGLPEINAGNAGVVPDPADMLGDEGTVFAKDYVYGNMECTVYLYKIPADENAFLTQYQAAAEANGFTVSTESVDGYNALALSYEGKQALLLPEYSGSVMLMVENGLTFGQPKPEGYYISFVRNGREIVSTGSPECEKDRSTLGGTNMFSVSYYFREEPITLFTIAFPDYAQAGDVFTSNKNNLTDGMVLYTAEEEFLMLNSLSNAHQFKSNSDFFTIEITLVEKDENQIILEGIFEGSFNNGQTTYEDGSFRVMMLR